MSFVGHIITIKHYHPLASLLLTPKLYCYIVNWNISTCDHHSLSVHKHVFSSSLPALVGPNCVANLNANKFYFVACSYLGHHLQSKGFESSDETHTDTCVASTNNSNKMCYHETTRLLVRNKLLLELLLSHAESVHVLTDKSSNQCIYQLGEVVCTSTTRTPEIGRVASGMGTRWTICSVSANTQWPFTTWSRSNNNRFVHLIARLCDRLRDDQIGISADGDSYLHN